MPAELLRDVGRTGDRAGARRLSVLPISVAVHVGIAIVLLIIPLAAEVTLPALPLLTRDYIAAVPVPPPPPAAPAPRGAQPARAPAATGAPIAAPPTIAPERNVAAADNPLPDVGVVGGVEGGTGSLGAAVVFDAAPPPPRVEPPAQPRRPGGDIREPRKLVNVAPVYPPLAIAGHVEGVVILDAIINVRGEVEQIRVIRSLPLLDQAAVDAVRRWRYTPTLLNGTAIPVLLTITIHFKIP